MIYPCLWFNQNAGEAARHYTELFPNGRIIHDSGLAVTFTIGGTRFMALNGGPKFTMNPAVSFFVYCGGEKEIDRLYEALCDGGKVIMPLQHYEWSSKYAWVEDRFGVSWQLDIDPINNAQTIVPTLLFCNEKSGLVKEAAENYLRIFPDPHFLFGMEAPQSGGLPSGSLLFAQFKLGGFLMNAMSSPEPQHYDFSTANSFVIECDTQEEIDHYWNELGAGGRYDMCGWLADRYGVAWQIVPRILPQLLSDPSRRERVINVFLQMQKFDLEKLMNA